MVLSVRAVCEADILFVFHHYNHSPKSPVLSFVNDVFLNMYKFNGGVQKANSSDIWPTDVFLD